MLHLFPDNRSHRVGFFLCRLEKPFPYSRDIQSGSGRVGLTAVCFCCCSCKSVCPYTCIYTATAMTRQKIRRKGNDRNLVWQLSSRKSKEIATFLRQFNFYAETTSGAEQQDLSFRCSGACCFSRKPPAAANHHSVFLETKKMLSTNMQSFCFKN